MMIAVGESDARAEDIGKHSPHDASDGFPLDWLYVPAVRQQLSRNGFDCVYAWDILANDEVPVIVTWKKQISDGKMMRISLGQLRRLIRETLDEEAWMPGRYYPSTNEPMSRDEQDRLNQPLGEDDEEEELDEVDTDPSNNPGRPDDAFDYLGMHPKPEAAMSHPFAGGGGGGGGEGGAAPAEPPDEAPKD